MSDKAEENEDLVYRVGGVMEVLEKVAIQQNWSVDGTMLQNAACAIVGIEKRLVIKEAVKAAMQFLADTLETAQEIRLEEVQKAGDGGWKLVFSLYRPTQRTPMIGLGSFIQDRELKRVTVNKYGEPVSITLVS